MLSNLLIVTNNSILLHKFENVELKFLNQASSLDLFVYVKHLVQINYEILTHPLYGNIKPSEMFFRTIVLKKNNELDLNSVFYIENAILKIEHYRRNKNDLNKLSKDIIEDFKLIDFDLINSAIARIY